MERGFSERLGQIEKERRAGNEKETVRDRKGMKRTGKEEEVKYGWSRRKRQELERRKKERRWRKKCGKKRGKRLERMEFEREAGGIEKRKERKGERRKKREGGEGEEVEM